ncbi:MAG: uroporphyrinogen decarboxylase family protein [Armatimonadota bacterium]
MTKRENYLRALRNQQNDGFVWAPNIDYWLYVSQAENTLPQDYLGMSRNEVVRSIGGSIWCRAVGLKTVRDSSVKETWQMEGDTRIHEFITPAGSIREVHAQTEGENRSTAVIEHFIKDIESLKVMKYVVEATHYEPDYEPTINALAEVGDDGIVLNSCFSVPFIQFAKLDAGYINGFYLWSDHRDEVDALIGVYQEKYLQGYGVLANGPADVIATEDNMDGVMISPSIFNDYAIPFYREANRVCHAGEKVFEGHWCGRTQNLLPLVPGCGLDVVEAIVTKPMADITLPDALDLLKGEVALQGGIPAVLVCDEGCTKDEFERYVQDVVLLLRGRKGFILGMSDNVPPNADFSRVAAVAELIR